MTTDETLPKAWADLLEAIALLATHRTDNAEPIRCEHDELTVMASPDEFTAAELDRLKEIGFHDNHDGESFYSYRGE